MNFTLETYSHICNTLKENYYSILTVNEYLTTGDAPRKAAILRHDVDRRPGTALRMARQEKALGLKATYYFRYVRGVFNPDIIKEIINLGHEVGYHYETLAKCRGDIDKAILLFAEELEAFRRICTVSTASMHGRPLSPWDNRKIWQKTTPSRFNLTGECYQSLDYNKMEYFSDTGRTWDPGRYNIRDHVQKNGLSPSLSRTEELIQYLQNNQMNNVCILTHPNRWSDGRFELIFSAGIDHAINQIKKLLLQIRR